MLPEKHQLFCGRIFSTRIYEKNLVTSADYSCGMLDIGSTQNVRQTRVALNLTHFLIGLQG